MTKISKIKAFTLIDILTGMTVGSIIIGAAYYFLLYVQTSEVNISNNSTNSYKTTQINTKINHLFFNCDSIFRKHNTLSFHQKQNVVYIDLNDHYLLLDDGVKDTLQWALISEKTKTLKSNPKIESLSLLFKFEDLEFEWYFYKKYGALFLQK